MLGRMSESNIPNLRKLREARGLTQVDVGDLLGKASRTILRWESGEQDPSLTDLRNIARVFNVSVAYLIGEEEAR